MRRRKEARKGGKRKNGRGGGKDSNNNGRFTREREIK